MGRDCDPFNWLNGSLRVRESPVTTEYVEGMMTKHTLAADQVDPVDPDRVFEKLEADRENGVLRDQVSSGDVNYQSCKSDPSVIERVNNDGSVDRGRFENGQLIVDQAFADWDTFFEQSPVSDDFMSERDDVIAHQGRFSIDHEKKDQD